MARVSLVAIKPHTYGRRRLKVGDAFEASPHDANVLMLLGRATRVARNDHQPAPAPAPQPMPVIQPVVPLEDVHVTETLETPETDLPEDVSDAIEPISDGEDAPKPRRRYQRRVARADDE